MEIYRYINMQLMNYIVPLRGNMEDRWIDMMSLSPETRMRHCVQDQ